MDEIDRLLSLVENPTRRRILESLVREPNYPLRLSKELGISQQAVMKNLTLMERNGLISSSRVDSDMGPSRIMYAPNSEFALVVEMEYGRFSARILAHPDRSEGGIGEDRTKIQKRIEQIDQNIEFLERKRSALMKERQMLTENLEVLTEEDEEKKQQND